MKTNKDINWYEGLSETIYWEGKPNIGMHLKSLEDDYYNTGVTPSFGNLLYIGIVVIIAKMIYGLDLLAALPFIVIFLLLPLVLDWHINKNHKLTQYALSTNYLQFKIKGLFKSKLHKVPIKNIVKIHEINYSNGQSTLVFECNIHSKFKTIDFQEGRLRTHPTFESLDNTEQLLSYLQPLVKANKVKPLVYTEPLIDCGIRKMTQKVFFGLIFLLSVYYADFYLLPSYTVSDRVTAVGNYSVTTTGPLYNDVEIETTGYVHQTLKGNEFSTVESIPIRKYPNVEIKLSPIFKQVKEVRNSYQSFNERVDSGLTGPFFFLFIFLVLMYIISAYLLNKELMDKEKYYKIIIYNVTLSFFIMVFWYFK